MLKLCRVNIERSGEAFEKIEKYVKKVVNVLKPNSISARAIDLNTFGIPVEPVGYTHGEFEEMEKARNPFVMEISESGKVMYKSYVKILLVYWLVVHR